MNEQLSYETDGFEFDTEFDTKLDELEWSSELSDELVGPSSGLQPAGGGCRCSCRSRYTGELDETEQENPLGALGIAAPSWLNPLFRLYRAGRLGWKAGRFIDKVSGKGFGKPISNIGADFLYKRLGRSRRLENFFDNLPPRVQRWLNQF